MYWEEWMMPLFIYQFTAKIVVSLSPDFVAIRAQCLMLYKICNVPHHLLLCEVLLVIDIKELQSALLSTLVVKIICFVYVVPDQSPVGSKSTWSLFALFVYVFT